MATFWLLLDFPSIKSFVFGTEAAREIRGGSAILDKLNREVLGHELRQAFKDRHEIVYAAGGGALVTFAEGISEEEIELAVNRYAVTVRNESGGGLRLSSHIEAHEGDEKATIAALHRGLAQKRYGGEDMHPQTHTGIFRACASCGTGCATTSAREYDEDASQRICESCCTKGKASRSGGFWSEYIRSYENPALDPWKLRPSSFEQICKASGPRGGYFAVVYGDGDAMGRLVKSIPNTEQYKIFSEVVDQSLRDATYEALRALYPNPESAESLAVDLLLLGGDDLVMAIQVDAALPFVLHAARRFQELTKERLQARNFFDSDSKETGLCSSFGIAIAKEKQPFQIVLEQAEALLKSAKKARADRLSAAKGQVDLCEPFVDLADVSQSRFLALDVLRKEDLGVGSQEEWTAWPRPLTSASLFYDCAQQLRRAELRKGRMHALTEAMMHGGSRSTFETQRLLTRLPSDRQNSTLRQDLVRFFRQLGMGDNPPWEELEDGRRRTAVLDLATLFPYLNPDIREESA